MENGTTYVGLDAHKKSIQVAVLFPGRGDALEWQVANEAGSLRRLAKKLIREAPGAVHGCYEAGVNGYALQRLLEGAGMKCRVVAPSLIPVKPGERVKTDRRDARKLAEFLRAGLLTEVHPPTPAEEAVRDLCRCREDAKADLMRSRHRLGKMLLRRGFCWTEGKRAWGQAHRRWLKSLHFDHEAGRTVFADYLLAVEQLEERLRLLEREMEEIARAEPYREPVAWLRCFRGIETVTALTIVGELHDFRRFDSPRGLMAYLGLVPGEHSSGESRRRGRITKAGNSHVRRILVESAWHYRHPAAVGAALRVRRQGQPRWVIVLADKAQRRLHQRFWRMTARGKPFNKAITAVARELVGFVWATLYGRVAEPA